LLALAAPAGYPSYEHHQDLFLRVSFNAQGFFDWLFAKPAPRPVI
jgi:hypothetical protein